MVGRIAVIFEYPTLNGGERSMLQSFDRIASTECEFVAGGPDGRLAAELRQRSIEFHPLSWRTSAGNKLPADKLRTLLNGFVRHTTPDLLHANSLSLGRVTGATLPELTIPTTAHLRDIIRLSGAAIADLNRNCRLFAVSEATKRFHVAQGLDVARTYTVYNGVDSEQFVPRPRTFQLHRELGLPEDCPLVTTIGQIGLRKGQDVLAEAAPRILERVNNVHFVIVGERNSEKKESVEYEQQLGEAFARAGISNHLHRLGYRNDVAAILTETAILVHPAKQEPLGRVLLEAAAAGTAIVATAVGGTEEILTDGVSARLVPPADAAALAAGVVELALDPRQRQRFADRARRYVVSDFSADQAAQNLCQHWRDLLLSPAGG